MSNDTCPVCGGVYALHLKLNTPSTMKVCNCSPLIFWQKIRELQAANESLNADLSAILSMFTTDSSDNMAKDIIEHVKTLLDLSGKITPYIRVLKSERDELINTNCETKHELVIAEQTITELKRKLADVKVWCPECKGRGQIGMMRALCSNCEGKGYTTGAK